MAPLKKGLSNYVQTRDEQTTATTPSGRQAAIAEAVEGFPQACETSFMGSLVTLRNYANGTLAEYRGNVPWDTSALTDAESASIDGDKTKGDLRWHDGRRWHHAPA